MNVLLRTVGVVVVGLVIAACGGGNGDGDGDGRSGDDAAIESLVREFFSALEDGDAGKLAALSSAECGDIEEEIASVFSQIEGTEIEVNVTGIDVRNLQEDSAEVAPQGTISAIGREQPLGVEGEYTRVVKEDGEWKIADCSYFLE